jgi:hypothetical protein
MKPAQKPAPRQLTKRQMLLVDRAEAVAGHQRMAAHAANTALPWGNRYECAVIADDWLDAVKTCDLLLQQCRD